jgi:SAM-dependent methyltransferase
MVTVKKRPVHSLTSCVSEPNARPCPACGCAAGEAKGSKIGFEMLSCSACRTLYTSSVPTSAQEVYDEYYGPKEVSTPGFVGNRLDEIVAGFTTYRKSNRLLDVGCGAGSLLEAAGRAGWAAEGLEVSRSAVAYARGLGFKIFHGELSEAGYPTGHFDVVTAFEVLEHVPSPEPILQEIVRVLRPGGVLWATTPHGRGMSARVLGLRWSSVHPPNHLQLFSRRGICELLSSAGFRDTCLASHAVNPYEILYWLRNRRTVGPDEGRAAFDHLTSAYQLNEYLTVTPLRRGLKRVVNGALSVCHLGDSLKIIART